MKSFFDKWCDQLWLYLLYLLAIIMGNILMLKWDVWSVPRILSCLLAIMIPAHVFEENTFPAGFFFMNNLNFKSKDPMVYPQNRVTNMVTNLGAEIVFIIMTAYAVRIEVTAVLVVIIFGVIELVNHTREGIHMYFRYRNKGKKNNLCAGHDNILSLSFAIIRERNLLDDDRQLWGDGYISRYWNRFVYSNRTYFDSVCFFC